VGQKGKQVNTVVALPGLQPSDRNRLLRAAPRDNPGAPLSVPFQIFLDWLDDGRPDG